VRLRDSCSDSLRSLLSRGSGPVFDATLESARGHRAATDPGGFGRHERVLSGLVDGGGGIIFVPALVYAARWDIKEAVAASLVVVVFASLSGTLRNLKSEDSINWRVAALLSSTAAPASLIGVSVSRVSPETVVQIAIRRAPFGPSLPHDPRTH
jgi:sulfite exporter TauE/SafE